MITSNEDTYFKDPGNNILLEELSVTYMQENDCTEPRDNNQIIKLFTRDGGGGKFIHMKTEGWSFSEEDDLVKLINHFKSLYDGSNNT